MSIILKSEVNRLIKYTEFEENLEILENNYISNKLKLPDTVINDDTNIFELRGSTGAFTYIGDGYYYPLTYNDSGTKNIPVNYGVSYIANVKGAYSADNLITQIVPKNLTLYTNINIVDTNATFYIKNGFNDTVFTTALQSDGKILIGGQFTTFNRNNRNRLIRLYSDGTDDVTFTNNMGSGFDNGVIKAIVVQPNGKILVGGTFTSFNGNIRNYIVRLNSDGTEDINFYTSLGYGFNDYINTISLQADGKILIGGYFNAFNDDNRYFLIRLNADCTEDINFYASLGYGFNDEVSDISIQTDGKILIIGNFNVFNDNTRNYLIRLNSDGTEDVSFYNNLGGAFNSRTNNINLQSDGKILICGYFNVFNNNNRNHLIRLNIDGTEDIAFYNNLGNGFDSFINTIEIQTDGKILIGGNFTAINGTDKNYLVRLNSDGTEDIIFYDNLGVSFNGIIGKVILQPNGKIIVVGGYSQFDTKNRNSITRLNNDGTDDTYSVIKYVTNTNGILSLKERYDNLYLFTTSNIQYMIYDISILKTIGGSTQTNSSSGNSTSS